MTWIHLALRNLLRNARRSVTTVAAVALGYAAINVLGGFTAYMFASIRDGHIYEQVNGHVQIWKKGARAYAGPDPGATLISAGDFAEIEAYAEADPRVSLVAAMLEIKGSIDFDGSPGYFFGQAMVPSEKDEIFHRSTALRSPDGTHLRGEALTDEDPFGIAVGTGLAASLGLDLGDDVILMTPTMAGQMNALDARVAQIADMTSEAVSSRYLFLHLDLARSLYETEGVSSALVLLRDESDTGAVAEALRGAFPEDAWEVVAWHDTSDLYRRTKRMFDIIFGLVFVIIALIVTMSVLNTIGMAVIERTREIGTLRAIGLKRPGVVRLFGTESALLGFIGAVVGLLLTMGVSWAVDAVAPVWEPPVTSREIVWEIRLSPAHLALTFVVLVLFTALAAVAPARRAARRPIVDALGHV